MLVGRCQRFSGLSVLSILCVLFLLSGCAESESDDSEPESKADPNPETVVVGQPVILTALIPALTAAEINPEDLVYVWQILSKPASSTAVLTDPASANPTFMADFQGTYTFRSSVFNQSTQNELLSENEFSVEALPQDPTSTKSGNHIDTNDNCEACHTIGEWVPAIVDHDHVLGQCVSCHQQPAGHVPASNDCSSCHDSESWAADRALFVINSDLWESSNIPTYQFTYRCSCLPEGDVVITVSNGVVTEAFYSASGDGVPAADLPGLMTIAQLFSIVDEELQSGSPMMVTYHIQHGYPQSIIIGASGETIHRVVDFQVVTPPVVNQDQVQLDENELLWQQANISNYQYTQRMGCFCPYREDIVVVVNAGVVVEAHFTPSGTPLTPQEIQTYNLQTVEQLFATIQSEIDRPAAALTVTYNATSGYPELITVDPIALVVDEEYSISVMDFQEVVVVPPVNPLQTALDEKRALWQQARLVDYQYTYRISCFCLPQEDIVVVVNAGVVVEAHFTPSGTSLTPAEIQSNNLRSVEQLFDVIQTEIDRPAAALTVTYNATSGYPELITVDQVAMIADDEFTISVMDLQEPVVVPPVNPLQTALDENRGLWQQVNITDYQYTHSRTCICPTELYSVTVRGGVVTEAIFVETNTLLTPEQIANFSLGIDGLFLAIQDAIDRSVPFLEVRYNPENGYPERIDIDYDSNSIDDELHHFVSDFQEIVVPPVNSLQTALDENRALWQQANIFNYQYTYNKSCFLCDIQEDIIVTVNSFFIIAAQFTPSGSLLSNQEMAANQLKTVEQMFDLIQAEIDRPAAELIVTYNAMSGYPESITVDPSAEIFDDQYTLTLSDFQEAPTTPSQDAHQTLLNTNMTLWQQAGLTDYQYTYHISCLCVPFQVTAIVSGGVIAEAFFVDTGEPLTSEQMVNLPGIGELFLKIQDAIDRNVGELNVTYNAEYGYPETIYIDYFSQIWDDEITHVVSDFQVIN